MLGENFSFSKKDEKSWLFDAKALFRPVDLGQLANAIAVDIQCFYLPEEITDPVSAELLHKLRKQITQIYNFYRKVRDTYRGYDLKTPLWEL